MYFSSDMASKPPEWQDRVFGQIIREIRNSLDWIGVDWVNTTADVGNAAKGGEVVRLLDYACGTGTVSQVRKPNLQPFLPEDASAAATPEDGF